MAGSTAPVPHNGPPPHLNQFAMPGTGLQPPNPSSTNQQPPPPNNPPRNQQPPNQLNPHPPVNPSGVSGNGSGAPGGTGSSSGDSGDSGNGSGATGGTGSSSGDTGGLTAFWSSDGLSFSSRADMEAFITASVEAGIKGASTVTAATTANKSQVQTPDIQEGYVGDLFGTGEYLSLRPYKQMCLARATGSVPTDRLPFFVDELFHL